MAAAIHIQNLSFSYGEQNVLNQLDLTVQPGERFGLFGPNGAGKTTLMSIITGLVKYHTGTVQIQGLEVKDNSTAVKKIIGFVPQDFSFYQELSPVENLSFFGAWAGLNAQKIKEKTSELLQVMALDHVKNKPVQHFSGGMKRRVNLAIAVMANPGIVILDEPTVGVDVQTRHAIIDYLKQLNNAGTTLLYTSHQLHEAEDLCNRFALMDEGRILVNDSLENLLQQHRQAGLEGLFLQLTGRAYRH